MSQPGLTIEQAQLVQRKNLENIVRKVSDGKVLSRQEFEMLDSIASAQGDEPTTGRIRSWIQLAKALGITRKTVWDLREHHNGPQEIDLPAWQKFLEQRASESPHWQNEEQQSDEMREIRFKLLKAQAGKEEATRKLRELEYERQNEGLVPMEQARDAVKKVMAPLRGLLDAHPKACAVQANPTDPQLAEEAMREDIQKIFELIQAHRDD